MTRIADIPTTVKMTPSDLDPPASSKRSRTKVENSEAISSKPPNGYDGGMVSSRAVALSALEHKH